MALDQQLRLNQFDKVEEREADPRIVALAAQRRQENRDLNAKLAALEAQLKEMEARNARNLDWEYNELPEEFGFEERYYQCTVPHPGVGYRFTPKFADKNDDGCGPVAGEVIIATAIVQGPQEVFVKCKSGNGWLPLFSVSNDVEVLKHLGKVSAVDLDKLGLKMAAHKDKVSSPKNTTTK
jgi:hypothetical protein